MKKIIKERVGKMKTKKELCSNDLLSISSWKRKYKKGVFSYEELIPQLQAGWVDWEVTENTLASITAWFGRNVLRKLKGSKRLILGNHTVAFFNQVIDHGWAQDIMIQNKLVLQDKINEKKRYEVYIFITTSNHRAVLIEVDDIKFEEIYATDMQSMTTKLNLKPIIDYLNYE